MRYFQYVPFSAQSISSSQQSSAIDASYLVSISVQAVSTSTAIGTLKMQFSNDAPGPSSPITWLDVPAASVLINGAGNYGIDHLQVCYQYIRFAFVSVSGTGNLTVKVKSLGF